MIREIPNLLFSLIVTIIIILFFISIIFPIIFYEKIREMELIRVIENAIKEQGYVGQISLNPIKYDILFDLKNNEIKIMKCHLDKLYLEKVNSSCTNDCFLKRRFEGCGVLKSFDFINDILIVSLNDVGINEYIMSFYYYTPDTTVVKTVNKKKKEGELLIKQEYGNLENISLFSFNYWVGENTEQRYIDLSPEYFALNTDTFKIYATPIIIQNVGSNTIKISVGIKI